MRPFVASPPLGCHVLNSLNSVPRIVALKNVHAHVIECVFEMKHEKQIIVSIFLTLKASILDTHCI
jgi:hypothetical protein